MTKITNSADLNNYYKDVVSAENGVKKKNKTRLIILKDKNGNEYLGTKKLSLTERIGALFGGKASFSRVVEFCNDKGMHSAGLAQLVGKYNQSHPSKQINYTHFVPGYVQRDKSLISALEPKNAPVTAQEILGKHEDDRIIDTNIKQAYESGNDDGLVALLERLSLPKKQQILDEACAAGEVRKIDLLHKSGMTDFNAKNSMYTPLMRAAEAGHEHVVSTLLNLGADPKIGTPNLGDPLLLAATLGHTSVVTQLASELKDSFTPERLVTLLGLSHLNDKVKKALINEAANNVNSDGKNALMLAIDAGKLDIADMVELRTVIETKDKNGDNALQHICRKGPSDARNDLIKNFLISDPAGAFEKNKQGKDALSVAADKSELRAEFEKYAKASKHPVAQKILERLAEDAQKAEESAQRLEDAKQAARQAEISKNLDIIKTEAGKQKVEDVRSLPALGQGQDTPLLVAYTAIDKTALKDTDPKVRGFILLDLTRRAVGTTKEDHETLITKNLTSARLPLMWLKAQLEKLPPTGASTKDKVAKLDFETKGKNLMAAYKPVIAADTYAKLLKDYPAFKPV